MLEVLFLQVISSNSTDSRIDQILSSLAAGKRREQIATELSYKSSKSLDAFMKKNKYTWDNKRNYYFPLSDALSKKEPLDTSWLHQPDSRTASVLSLLNQGHDLKEIAEQLRFADHRELALYMKNKGYIWNEDSKKYHFKSQLLNSIPSSSTQKDIETTASSLKSLEHSSSNESLYEFLEKNKNVLYQLVSSHIQTNHLPRYTIPGVYITKSISMNYGMDMLIRSYSQDKNVSQKDIVEIALVDFFSKYGYQQEINTLLGK